MSTNFENSEEKRINCEGGFGIMPHRLRKSENISSSAKLLFCALVELQHEKGYCYASNRYLAMEEFNGVSTRSIQLWLSELEREGWIKIIITRNEENEVVDRRIYTNLNQNTPHENFMTPPEKFFTTPPEKNFAIKRKSNEKEIKENLKRKTDLVKSNPASGSPSSPDGDEFKKPEDAFGSFWKNVQYKSQKVIARNEWNKITNNGKNQNKIKEVGEGYERYVSFLAKERARGFDRPHMDMSTFLNPSKMRWTEEWKTEREQRQEQQNNQTENQKYWEEHENTQVIASKKIEQPKDLNRRIGIARKLNLLDRFLPDEYNNEWKFIPKEIKEILISDAVENVIKQVKSKEDALITQIACVTMMGRQGYINWKDKYEEETGERPTLELEDYIPFDKKLPSDIWGWLLKYSHKIGLPSESKIEDVRKWFYKNPRNPFYLLFA